MDLEQATIAVTGATGFLGSHIALQLLERGAKVRGVVRSPEKGQWLKDRGVEFAKADLMDAQALQDAFRGVDAVISNAALFTVQKATWEDFYKPNKLGTENVYNAIMPFAKATVNDDWIGNALCLVAANKKMGIFNELVEFSVKFEITPENLSVKDAKGRTALHLVAKNEKVAVVNKLIDTSQEADILLKMFAIAAIRDIIGSIILQEKMYGNNL